MSDDHRAPRRPGKPSAALIQGRIKAELAAAAVVNGNGPESAHHPAGSAIALLSPALDHLGVKVKKRKGGGWVLTTQDRSVTISAAGKMVVQTRASAERCAN